ncbi:TonB-dependent receptor [Pedobacter yulinensis]|uniref:TonB-dependent receptor n=1 Tax=Pedobacter yulinensis TaxID=2126353 RepID=A0A2T3HHI6_9SPHI|nr:TonB-dependent receptor [Pedobacter yulinensis]PST81905.1 TonB-dependent receptor [Pedobacter yulinensis]
MSRIFTRLAMVLLALCTGFFQLSAQTVNISGAVTDKATGEALPGVSVTVRGTTSGTSTDSNGKFAFSTTGKGPFTLVVSYLGYATQLREVSASSTGLSFQLETTANTLGQDVVISASRTPERILESPVSIERIGVAAIRDIPAPSFYDALNNIKGVEMSAQSLTFKSVNTRGFNSNGNTRFNQFVDGMDNQAPGLNFSVGNIVGMTELDVENVELLPGASSALYGAGGINGTLLMTSKNPFDYQGASFQFKTGINHVNDGNVSAQPFNQLDVRLAKAWNNKFGIKTAFSFLQARDWYGTDGRNFDRTGRQLKAGDRASDPNYDGVNVYGDEINANLQGVSRQLVAGFAAQQPAAYGAFNSLLAVPGLNYSGIINAINTNPQFAALRPALPQLAPVLGVMYSLNRGTTPSQAISRTGYNEADLVDYNTSSLKTSTALHYKFTNTIQAIAQANWGTGTSVYTGTDRYSLRNFSIGQYKLELRGEDFYLKGYTTQERSGDAYNATLLGTFINEAWKPSSNPTNPTAGWFAQYTLAYSGARAQGLSEEASHAAARGVADQGRLVPGSPAFNLAKEAITKRTIGPANGARFNDKTNLYHYEGMYNFTNAFNKAVEFQVGASYRLYDLRSDGTIFDDLNRKLTIKEYGAFGQLGKKFFEDKLKLTVAGRFDKSQNFEGRFTPRITGVYTVAPNNNIRASYQTGFRNPTTQDQYIDLAVAGGSTRLIGGLPEFIEKYKLNTNRGYLADDYRAYAATAATSPTGVGDLSKLNGKEFTFDSEGLRPERVASFELGYKGLLDKSLLIDLYGYYNTYQDFIGAVELFQKNVTAADPTGLQSPIKYNVPVNIGGDVNTYGGALGLDYLVGKFSFNGNTSYNKIGDLPAGLLNTFNTPEWRFNAGIGAKEIVKHVGFNVQYRWQDEFYWNSTFGSGMVPAFSTVDAQINYRIPSVNSVLKLGGSNIANKYYTTSFGNPAVGAIYYLALTFNP